MHEKMKRAFCLLQTVIIEIENAPTSRTLEERKEQVSWLNQVCYLVTDATTRQNQRLIGDLNK